MARETHTVSARKSIEARITWWAARAKTRGFTPFPLNEEKLWLAGALLKQGGYKTSEQYLYAIKRKHTQLGHQWHEGWTPLLADIRRSCKRGMGPPKRAAPLVGHLKVTPYRHQQIASICDVIGVGCSWLLREIELAALQVKDAEFQAGTGCGSVALTIAASKTDTMAYGAVRTLPCTCPQRECPVAAVKRLCLGKQPFQRLVQSRQGVVVTKEKMVEALKEFGVKSGMADITRITGHSMRVTGAQRLVKAGLSMDQIKLFGRWKSSNHMFAYLRETAINADIMKSAMTQGADSSVGSSRHAHKLVAMKRKWPKLHPRRS